MVASLIAIFALLMLYAGSGGTGWTSELEKPIKKHVADKTHRETVLDALDAHEDGTEEVADALQEHFTGLLNAHIDFQSSEKTFDAVTEELTADQVQSFKLDMELRRKMKAELSESEWNAVFSEENK
jgi:hypothetical protein